MHKSLRKVPLFEELSEADLEKLCEDAEEIKLRPGEDLFAEGTQGDHAYVIQSGELEIVKMAQGQEMLLAVRGEGELIGEMALLQKAPRMATVRARGEADVLAIGFGNLDELLNNNPASARTMLQTITSRLGATQALLHNNEKMAQLGSLAAGMAHELNNPSTAALRGSQQLRAALDKLQKCFFHISATGLDEGQAESLFKISDEIREISPMDNNLDALAKSDLENEIEEWLEAQGVEAAWEYAPTLATISFGAERLKKIQDEFPGAMFGEVVDWISGVYTIRGLILEIGEGAQRISELVNALKSYSFLDQAPTQSVDIHEGLNDTLLLLRNKLKKGVVVSREFDPDLPAIHAHGSELNQVWTNIIDNAIQAMEGEGKLRIRTRQDDEHVVIEITDSGPGIPPENLERIFEPYFTSKPAGVGTGLGLDISRKIISERHNGQITAASRPGETTFSVSLPKSNKAKGE